MVSAASVHGSTLSTSPNITCAYHYCDLCSGITTLFNNICDLSKKFKVDYSVFFAGNGCGDYYCYNVTSDGVVEEDKIYIWEHEDNTCRVVAANIEELIRRYINDEI